MEPGRGFMKGRLSALLHIPPDPGIMTCSKDVSYVSKRTKHNQNVSSKHTELVEGVHDGNLGDSAQIMVTVLEILVTSFKF